MKRFWEMILAWVFGACLFLIFSVGITLICGEISILPYFLKASAVGEGIVIFLSIWDYFIS